MSFVAVINFLLHRQLVPTSRLQRPNRLSSSVQCEAPKPSNSYLWEDDHQEPLLDSQSDETLRLSIDLTKDIEGQLCTEPGLDGVGKSKKTRIDARLISDATIGLSDGLTVPFALTAGLSALGNTDVVIYGGLAELIAGAISMGLGGYLGAKAEAASYRAQQEKVESLLDSDPESILRDLTAVFRPYGIPHQTMDELVSHLSKSPKLVDFMMQFEHRVEEPAASRAIISASTIALGYFIGGMLPLLPYFFVAQVRQGLLWSIGLMIIALFAFGYAKTGIIEGWRGGRNIRSCCFGGIEMIVVGGAAAAAAMGLVKLFEHHGHAEKL